MTTALARTDTFGMGVAAEEKKRLIATFLVDGEYFGVDALEVQEIVKSQRMRPVPHAPAYVLGLINLRGQILTTIDLRFRLTGKRAPQGQEAMNLIMKGADGVAVSVLVDDVGDVIEVGESQLETPPDTLDRDFQKFVSQVCKLDDRLLTILDSARITGIDDNPESPN